MGWSVGYDDSWHRWIGYGVPAYCDHPGCGEEIDRGLGHVCGGVPYGGENGCGLFFCEKHLFIDRRGFLCERCSDDAEPFEPQPEHPRWMCHLLIDESWAEWRAENPDEVARLREATSVTASEMEEKFGPNYSPPKEWL